MVGTAAKVKADRRSEESSEECACEESVDAPSKEAEVKQESDMRPVLPRRRTEESVAEESPKKRDKRKAAKELREGDERRSQET